MITYDHGTTVFHRLDPRSKLLGQVGFAIAAFAHASPLVLGVLTALALAGLAVARLSVRRVLRTFWFILFVLALGVVFAGATLGSPWFETGPALDSVVAGYQVVLVLFVSSVYVRTTPVRETRAAVQRHVPGKLGQLLGVGMGLVFRFFPVLWSDVGQIRLALKSRAGDGLGTVEWIRRLSLVSLQRALERSETLSLALRARCFAWNPTLPHLSFSWLDVPMVGVAVVLTASALV